MIAGTPLRFLLGIGIGHPESVTTYRDDGRLPATGDPSFQTSRNGGRNRRSAIAQAPAAGSASTV